MDALANTNMPLSGIVPRLRLAAAEIRRLRNLAEYWKERHEEVNTVQVTTLTKVREAGDWEDFRAGIEAAAKWHDGEAFAHYTQRDVDKADLHTAYAAAIRALADAPKNKGG